MKKLITIIFVLLISGCSDETKKDDEFKYILFATPLKDHAIWLQAKDGFFNACDEEAIKCDWLGPSVIDTQEMEDVIETGILQRADAIITQGVVDTALVNAASQLGIPIFLVDSDLPTSQRFAYMGKDFNEQAKLLMDDIETRYGNEKHLKIAIQVAESSFTIAQEQIDEIQNVFANHQGGLEIVSISESKSDPVRAKKEWERVLSQNPDINVTINFAAESAELCAEFAIEKGIRDDMLIYGVDDMPSTLKDIKEGKVDGTIVTSFYDYGYKSVKMLLEYIQDKKEPINKIFSPTLVLVTKDNVDTYDK